MLRNLFASLFRRAPKVRQDAANFVPDCEPLEERAMMAVASLNLNNRTLVVRADNVSTSVEVRSAGSNIQVVDLTTNRTFTYAASNVSLVEFHGGSGNDRFVDLVTTLAVRAFGNNGNDYLRGAGGADTFDGGAGHDVLLGGEGNDTLSGGDGNDRLNGGGGTDRLFGQNGDDILITVDNTTADSADGGAGRDTLWGDVTGGLRDTFVGVAAEDKAQLVASFANGADRTLNADRIADPRLNAGASYRTFAGNALFASAGPQASDIRQGNLGDCWMLAGLSAVAADSPQTLKNAVVDFDDGTYGVALGGRFFRVDNDLPVFTGTSNLAYAQLGAENSLWVSVVEKAFASYRTGANSYASIEGGWGVEVNRAFGSTTSGGRDIQSYGSAANLANDLFARWTADQAVTIGFLGLRPGSGSVPLVMGHMYTVSNVIRNAAGVVTSIVVRNPWGVDGGGNVDSNTRDGLVTVTPEQLFRCNGAVNWGRV